MDNVLKALDYIKSINREDAIYNIVFISDGEPNGEDYKDALKQLKDFLEKEAEL